MLLDLVISLKKGRARYRPIDDRARYWENLFWGGGKMNFENFQRKKKKKNIVGIRTHAHSFPEKEGGSLWLTGLSYNAMQFAISYFHLLKKF